ncbi:MAG: MBL fold metallo-hydrolase [Chitinophagaceae bacterium]
MPLYITSLNSGSNGNCYYIGNNSEAILVDAGISCLEIQKRMQRLGLSMDKIKAVFVSHEHTDHIKGVAVLAKRFQIPVYITPATLFQGGVKLDSHLVRSFLAHEPINIGELSITAFPKCHDASDPYSFSISSNDLKVGVFTDIGSPCDHLINHFKQCHAAFLEANYDELMLENGSYPHFLKTRIRGGKGHLSNKQALELFTLHRPMFMSHLVLSHLSKNNNCPDLVSELFNKHAMGVKIIVAGRYAETEVICIENITTTVLKSIKQKFSSTQLAFSFA